MRSRLGWHRSGLVGLRAGGLRQREQGADARLPLRLAQKEQAVLEAAGSSRSSR